MPTLTIDDSTVYYRMSKRASPDTPAAVCLHGSGADSIVWAYQVSRLVKQFRVIAPDLPGHGQSDGAALDSAHGYARWVDRFVRGLGLDRFFLMGHSFGGAIVQEYAHLYPEKLKGMVLAATGTGFRFSQTYRELHDPGRDAGKIDIAELPHHMQQGYDMLKSVSGPSLHADLLAAGAFDSSNWIASVRVPALVLWGNRDFITPRDLPAELARQLPQSEFHVIDGAGHVLMVEASKAFNDAVAQFLSRIENV